MLYQVALAVVFTGSVVVRRPLTGYLIAALYRADPGWVRLGPVRRTMSELTLAWATLFGFRAGVYAVLIALGPGGLARGGLDRDGLAGLRAAHVRKLPVRAGAARAARRAAAAARRARADSLSVR